MSIILTGIAGVGSYFLREEIFKITFLKESNTYLPIRKEIKYVANKLRNIVSLIDFLMKKILRDHYSYRFDFCVGSPAIEELVNRLLFQKISLKLGMEFCAKQLRLSYDGDRLHWQIFRIGLTALVFATQHKWAFKRDRESNPYGAATLIYLVSLGTITGIAQETTGNVLHPIAIHVIHNTMASYYEVFRFGLTNSKNFYEIFKAILDEDS